MLGGSCGVDGSRSRARCAVAARRVGAVYPCVLQEIDECAATAVDRLDSITPARLGRAGNAATAKRGGGSSRDRVGRARDPELAPRSRVATAPGPVMCERRTAEACTGRRLVLERIPVDVGLTFLKAQASIEAIRGGALRSTCEVDVSRTVGRSHRERRLDEA